MRKLLLSALAGALLSPMSIGAAEASVLKLNMADFGVTNVFNRVRDFDFKIDLAGPFVPGMLYDNPALSGVTYFVLGRLTDPTPSGFPGFRLERTIGGAEFYSQGSELSFSIRPDAELSDGLQVSELNDLGGGVVLRLYAREVDTGRYHPPELVLLNDGTGRIRNADNTGGTNPMTMMEVDVGFGAEYVADLSFDPDLTISSVPLPPAIAGMAGALAGLVYLRRRRPVA